MHILPSISSAPPTPEESSLLELGTLLQSEAHKKDLKERIRAAQMDFLHTLCSSTDEDALILAAQKLQRIAPLTPQSTHLPLGTQPYWSSFAMSYQGPLRVLQLSRILHYVPASDFVESLASFLKFYAQEHQIKQEHVKQQTQESPKKVPVLLPDLALKNLTPQSLAAFSFLHHSWFDLLMQFATNSNRFTEKSLQARHQLHLLQYLFSAKEAHPHTPYFFWNTWKEHHQLTLQSLSFNQNLNAVWEVVKLTDFHTQGVVLNTPLEHYRPQHLSVDAFLQICSPPPATENVEVLKKHKEMLSRALLHLHKAFSHNAPKLSTATSWGQHTIIAPAGLGLVSFFKNPPLDAIPEDFLRQHLPPAVLRALPRHAADHGTSDFEQVDWSRAALWVEPFLPSRIHSPTLAMLEKMLPLDATIAYFQQHHPSNSSAPIKPTHLSNTLFTLHASSTPGALKSFLLDFTQRSESKSQFFPLFFTLQHDLAQLQQECFDAVAKRLKSCIFQQSSLEAALLWAYQKVAQLQHQRTELKQQARTLLEHTKMPQALQNFCLQQVFEPHKEHFEAPWKKPHPLESSIAALNAFGIMGACAYVMSQLEPTPKKPQHILQHLLGAVDLPPVDSFFTGLHALATAHTHSTTTPMVPTETSLESFFYKKNEAFASAGHIEPLEKLYHSVLAAQEEHALKHKVPLQGLWGLPVEQSATIIAQSLGGRTLRDAFLQPLIPVKSHMELDSALSLFEKALVFTLQEEPTAALHLILRTQDEDSTRMGFFKFFTHLQDLYHQEQPLSMASFLQKYPEKKPILEKFFHAMHIDDPVDLLDLAPTQMLESLCDRFTHTVHPITPLFFSNPSETMLHSLYRIDPNGLLESASLWRFVQRNLKKTAHPKRSELLRSIEQLELLHLTKNAPERTSGAPRL